jgi:hypothetical protein
MAMIRQGGDDNAAGIDSFSHTQRNQFDFSRLRQPFDEFSVVIRGSNSPWQTKLTLNTSARYQDVDQHIFTKAF